ncbi:hypothetical protein MMC22_010720 [Lobaria immixta]|nr:hypothetical protein [Lobaria immixta]
MSSSQVTLKVAASDEPFIFTERYHEPRFHASLWSNWAEGRRIWAVQVPNVSENFTDLLQEFQHSHLRSLSCLALHGELHLQQLRRLLQIQTSNTKTLLKSLASIYEETFSHTLRQESLGCFLSLVAYYGFEIEQMDVSRCILEGDLEEEVRHGGPPRFDPTSWLKWAL